jgi:hypothetical protein
MSSLAKQLALGKAAIGLVLNFGLKRMKGGARALPTGFRNHRA